MNKLISISIMACLLPLVSCSSDHDTPAETSDTRYAIRVMSADGGALTRTPSQDTQLAAGEKVYVWAFMHNGGAPYDHVTAWNLQGTDYSTGGSARQLAPISSYDVKFYPESKENIDLKAIHGSEVYSSGTAFPSVVNHQVSADQSTASGLHKSDLLYAATTAGYGPQDINFNEGIGYFIPLTFNHQLAHVTVSISAAHMVGFTYDQVQSVTIGGVTRSCTMVPGSAAVASGTQDQEVVMYLTKNASDGSVTAEAILPPQVVAETASFLTVHVKRGTSVYDVVYKPTGVSEAGRTIAVATSYTYDLTCNLFSDIQLTATITPWSAPVSLGSVENEL